MALRLIALSKLDCLTDFPNFSEGLIHKGFFIGVDLRRTGFLFVGVVAILAFNELASLDFSELRVFGVFKLKKIKY